MGLSVPWPQAGPKSHRGPSALLRGRAEAPAKRAEPWASPPDPAPDALRWEGLDHRPRAPPPAPALGCALKKEAPGRSPVTSDDEALQGQTEGDVPRLTDKPDASLLVSTEAAEEENFVCLNLRLSLNGDVGQREWAFYKRGGPPFDGPYCGGAP